MRLEVQLLVEVREPDPARRRAQASATEPAARSAKREKMTYPKQMRKAPTARQLNERSKMSLSGGGGGFWMCLRAGLGRMMTLAMMRQASTTKPPVSASEKSERLCRRP